MAEAEAFTDWTINQAADWGVSAEEKRYREMKTTCEHIVGSTTKIRELLDTIKPVVQLKSDYLGTDAYYYNSTTNTIYAIDNLDPKLRTLTSEENAHIRELNSLPAPSA